MLSIVYQNKALRAIRECVVVPTHFVEHLGRHTKVEHPGFAVIGKVFGRERTFYVIEDQLFLLTSSGKQYRLGGVQESTLEQLKWVRLNCALAGYLSREEYNQAADARANAQLQRMGFEIPDPRVADDARHTASPGTPSRGLERCPNCGKTLKASERLAMECSSCDLDLEGGN